VNWNKISQALSKQYVISQQPVTQLLRLLKLFNLNTLLHFKFESNKMPLLTAPPYCCVKRWLWKLTIFIIMLVGLCLQLQNSAKTVYQSQDMWNMLTAPQLLHSGYRKEAKNRWVFSLVLDIRRHMQWRRHFWWQTVRNFCSGDGNVQSPIVESCSLPVVQPVLMSMTNPGVVHQKVQQRQPVKLQPVSF